MGVSAGVAADVAGDLAAAGGMTDQDRVVQVEGFDEGGKVVGVGVQVVAVCLGLELRTRRSQDHGGRGRSRLGRHIQDHRFTNPGLAGEQERPAFRGRLPEKPRKNLKFPVTPD